MYLVVWTTRERRDFAPTIDTDHWEACETLAEARARYAELIEQADTYTASIAGVIDSTDYTPAKLEG